MSLILFIIALFVAATLFGWFLSVLRSAFTIAIALLLLKFLLGIEPNEVLQPITRFFQRLDKELNLGQYTSGIDFAQLWYNASKFVQTTWQQLIGG